ncbi:MAG: hypothetical protein HFE80_11990 [Clostridiaceae bacterium]|jgi:hypothetical protein|nr:hypothetical protein [Clostridiaceae bacterium]
MEFLRFIFSSFWVWAGFLVLVAVVLNGAAELVKACKQNRKVAVYTMGGVRRVEIENATRGDTAAAMRGQQEEGGLNDE